MFSEPYQTRQYDVPKDDDTLALVIEQIADEQTDKVIATAVNDYLRKRDRDAKAQEIWDKHSEPAKTSKKLFQIAKDTIFSAIMTAEDPKPLQAICKGFHDGTPTEQAKAKERILQWYAERKKT
jgi:hypothetical protein